MIHPHTELRFISPEIGYGVFASRDIPAGTIVYAKDSLEIVVSPADYLTRSPEVCHIIEKYSYIDERGDRIMSWDFAKYVNHCCRPNSISTGYGFEMALEDIPAGTQLTDEYGIFNLEWSMECGCGSPHCRGTIRPNDFDTHYLAWDERIRAALPKLWQVDQPLYDQLDPPIQRELAKLQEAPNCYRSVYALRYLKDNNGTTSRKGAALSAKPQS